jgi:hypothetical protein
VHFLIIIIIFFLADYSSYQKYVVKYLDLCNDTEKLVKWVEVVQKVGIPTL